MSNDAIMHRCYEDILFFAKLFFPDYFYRPFDPLHYQIAEVLQSNHCRAVCAAPRGIGKTTLATMVKPAHSALFQESRFIMPVSATSDLAQMLSENLKHALLSNTRIKAVFGDITSTDVVLDTGVKDKQSFNQKGWTITTGDKGFTTFICPRGGGQQVRGLNYRGRRPDLIIVDDLDDPRYIKSEEQRLKLRQWFRASLSQTVDVGSDDWQMLFLGTIQHEDSQLQTLLDSLRWFALRLELCDDDFKSNAPHYKTDDECRDLYEEFKEDGMLDDFFREFRNIPAATGSDAVFPDSFFKSYDPVELEPQFKSDPSYEYVLLADIARTAKPNSAESALVAVAVNTRMNAFYVRDIMHGRWHIDEFMDNIVHMCEKNDIRTLGAEVTGLNEYATYPIETILSQSGLDRHVQFIQLHARGGVEGEKGKTARIRTLQPFYRKGLIYHNPSCCGVLEQQLRAFPRSKLWDVMDAFAYIIEIMDIGDRFMMPIEQDLPSLYDTSQQSKDFEKEMSNLSQRDLPPLIYHTVA